MEIARRYGIPSWNSVILQVSSDDRERLSSAETQVRRASEHALLQEETLARFGQLFRDSYPEEYRRRRLGAAAYRLLAGDRAAAREHLRESGLPRRDRRRLGLTLLSFLPHSLTRRAFVRFRREHRRV